VPHELIDSLKPDLVEGGIFQSFLQVPVLLVEEQSTMAPSVAGIWISGIEVRRTSGS
jgi:hypothetical protein